MESRVSSEQLEILLDHLISHPGLAKGYGLGGRSKETSERLWNDLATRINAVGSGTNKTGVQWKRYWIDLKHKAKTKAAALRREHNATGGGPSQTKPISDTFKKVLSIIGEEAACGDVQYRVPVFDIEQSSPPTVRRQLFPRSETITSSQTQGLSPTEEQSKGIREINSPSIHGHTTTIVLDCADETASAQVLNIDRPTSNVQADTPQSQPRSSHSRNRRRVNLRSARTDNNWVVDLETRRIAAEEKLSEAIRMMAEAAKTNAQAAIIQAEAAQTQATALLNIAELLKK